MITNKLFVAFLVLLSLAQRGTGADENSEVPTCPGNGYCFCVITVREDFKPRCPPWMQLRYGGLASVECKSSNVTKRDMNSFRLCMASEGLDVGNPNVFCDDEDAFFLDNSTSHHFKLEGAPYNFTEEITDCPRTDPDPMTAPDPTTTPAPTAPTSGAMKGTHEVFPALIGVFGGLLALVAFS